MVFKAVSLTLFPALALGAEVYGPELQGFEYPYPVAHFEFASQRERMHMAYMDVHPQQGGGRTVVVLHGKNFCAAPGVPPSKHWSPQAIESLRQIRSASVSPVNRSTTSTRFSSSRATRTRCCTRWGFAKPPWWPIPPAG
jgi:hypothetical protein